MNRMVTVIVNNRTGVLNRITGVLLKRGSNIQSITVGLTEVPGVSRMTIVLDVTSEVVVEQVMKQLHKQIDVLKVADITDVPVIARELALMRVRVSMQNRTNVTGLIEPFRATITDVGRESITVQATGRAEKIDALIALLRPYGIVDLARTGMTALPRDVETVNEMVKSTKNTVTVL